MRFVVGALSLSLVFGLTAAATPAPDSPAAAAAPRSGSEFHSTPDVAAMLQDPAGLLGASATLALSHVEAEKVTSKRIVELAGEVTSAARFAAALADPVARTIEGWAIARSRDVAMTEWVRRTAEIRAAELWLQDSVTAWRAEVAAEEKRIKAAEEAAARAAAAAAAARSGGYSGATPSTGWFERLRAILNSVGGSHVKLMVCGSTCGGHAAVSSPKGVIYVSPALDKWTPARKKWAMMHELAHQYQFAVWDAIQSSPKYASLFGKNIELLANCMTSARGMTNHGHHSQCNAKRIAWAAGIWKGVVG